MAKQKIEKKKFKIGSAPKQLDICRVDNSLEIFI